MVGGVKGLTNGAPVGFGLQYYVVPHVGGSRGSSGCVCVRGRLIKSSSFPWSDGFCLNMMDSHFGTVIVIKKNCVTNDPNKKRARIFPVPLLFNKVNLVHGFLLDKCLNNP